MTYYYVWSKRGVLRHIARGDEHGPRQCYSPDSRQRTLTLCGRRILMSNLSTPEPGSDVQNCQACRDLVIYWSVCGHYEGTAASKEAPPGTRGGQDA